MVVSSDLTWMFSALGLIYWLNESRQSIKHRYSDHRFEISLRVIIEFELMAS